MIDLVPGVSGMVVMSLQATMNTKPFTTRVERTLSFDQSLDRTCDPLNSGSRIQWRTLVNSLNDDDVSLAKVFMFEQSFNVILDLLD